MRANIKLFYFIIAIALALTNCKGDLNDNSKELEGKWYGKTYNMTVSGNNFLLTNVKGDTLTGTISYNPNNNPKTIDLTITGGNSTNFFGLSSLGIYQLSKDTLLCAFQLPGNSLRPTDFSGSNGATVFNCGRTPNQLPVAPAITIPVLNTPINNSSQVFLLTYFNEPGCQPATSDNPLGLHKGIDFAGPSGTAIIASAPGEVVNIQNLEGTASNVHTVVLEKLDGGFTLNYNLEPAKNIFVIIGQHLQIGDTIGLLGDCGIAIGYMGNDPVIPKPTIGYGIVDFRAIDPTTGNFDCLTPLASSQFKSLMEELFKKNFSVTAQTPGPCTCHYSYP